MSRKLAMVGGTVMLFVFLAATLPAAEDVMFQGRPTFREGSDRSYFVWKDGNQWHVRWTTLGKMLRFSGSVIAEGGKLKSLDKIDVEKERDIIRPGGARVVVGPRGRVRGVVRRPAVVAEREQDKIDKEDDHTIRFVARTNDDIDGFDFKVDDSVKVLRFRLEIEGNSQASEVQAGRNNEHPRANPFVVNLR
jgi:hypothetical protein